MHSAASTVLRGAGLVPRDASDRVLNISSGLTEAIAIVSILSGAAVAIVVPFISARLERSRMKQQSREARTAELHALLDGAAQHLYEAWTILYEVEQVPRELPRPEWSDQQLRKLSDRLTEHVDTLSLDSIRISVRTSKRSPVTAAFYRARGPIDGYELEFRRFRESERRELDKPPAPPTGEVQAKLGEFMEEIRAFAGVVDDPAVSR